MDLQSQEKKERILKQRIEQLEKENYSLKKSLLELSIRFGKYHSLSISDLLSSDVQVPETPKIQKLELKGHQGAVYDVKFSKCGKYLASASFDKTVRVWDYSSQKELTVLQGHQSAVSDLSWFDTIIVSGGYDQTVKVWDSQSGRLLQSVELDGFVQCVQTLDSNVYFAGTSRNVLACIDKRQPQPIIIKNDSMVNTINLYKNGMFVVTGDAFGSLKTWDIRTGMCVYSQLNESTKKPISCISSCDVGEDDARFVAVNSYDNVMRVYDRGFDKPSTNYQLIHAIKGYKNKNWPIKSSFFKLAHFKTSAEDLFKEDRDSCSDKDAFALLATGSAEPFVYLYSMGVTPESVELVQRLEGHTDRVYACHFHPTEPLLASGSADFTIKIWNVNPRKKK